jgi:hypothetical protein
MKSPEAAETTGKPGGGEGVNGNFHLIHVVVGAWLVLAPLLGIFATFQGLVWNSVIIGAVIGLYNAWYLFGRQQQAVKDSR